MTFIYIAQIVVALLLIISILLQSRGGGLSSVFGGSSTIFQVKRGAEKFIFNLTIVSSVLFVVLCLAPLFI
ncbi:MAG TPA: preprotein translocase subunit SecG [bacterium]|jgi:protein translocase SecG subunit|nr:preprotein translocase subunit SecG [bacterium]HOG38318.1 preprotein translocase subunit SecG [bacterium]HQI03281.1 preprotein translocase subunit SecG [bacterium]